jgi:hypothetical protein
MSSHSSPIRVLVVDDHQLIRVGIATLLLPEWVSWPAEFCRTVENARPAGVYHRLFAAFTLPPQFTWPGPRYPAGLHKRRAGRFYADSQRHHLCFSIREK